VLAGTLVFTATVAHAADPATSLPSTELRAGGAGPLPSWNEGKATKSIVDFVANDKTVTA